MLIKRCWFDLKSRFLWIVVFFLCFSAHFFNVCSIVLKLYDGKIYIRYNPNYFFSERIFNGYIEAITQLLEDHTFFVDIYWFSFGSGFSAPQKGISRPFPRGQRRC